MLIEHFGSETHLLMEILYNKAVINALHEVKEEYTMILQDDRMMMRMGRVCSVGEDWDILYFNAKL